MKKLIVATSGLMLLGAMVSSASGAVSMGGDARARWQFSQYSDATDATENDERFSSRIRVKFNAEAKGGAYAKVRLRMADAVWDGTNQTRARGEGSNLYTDWAYIGVPVGSVTLEAGLMPIDLTKFSSWDERADMVSVKWAGDMTTLQFWYMKNAEYTNAATDTIDDEDVNTMALIFEQTYPCKSSITAAGFFTDDQTAADESGFSGFIHINSPIGPVTVEAEFAYVEGDVYGRQDDGLGGYIQGGMNFGAASLAINTGFTKDGYVADDDFGFLMVGGDTAITMSATQFVGQDGDTFWAGGICGFKMSEDLSLQGNLVYVDVDEFGSLIEISGGLKYVISDGANLEWLAGYVSMDDDAGILEDPLGTAVTLNVSF